MFGIKKNYLKIYEIYTVFQKKTANIDVLKLVHLPAAKQRIFNYNILTVIFLVLPNIYEHFGVNHVTR